VRPLLLYSKTFQKGYQTAIQERVKLAMDLLKGTSFIPPEGGFYMTIDLGKSSAGEEEVACQLLEKYRILAHPGYFYDLKGDHLIISFVSRPQVLRKALSAVIAEIR
jgi:aspartate/methionine/tyrosine aminotransferase